MKNFSVRFWEKVNCAGSKKDYMPTCCWEWTASKNRGGYGQIGVATEEGYKIRASHRIALGFVLGREPVYVMHLCDNPACVRPSHLKEGTNDENIADMLAKGRSRYKVTPQQVEKIKALALEGHSFSSIAARFNISKSQAHQIGRVSKRTV